MPRIGGTDTLTPTPASSMTLVIDPTVPQLTGRWTAGQNETINVSGTPSDGQWLTLIISNDGSVRTITFGTGLLSKGTLVGVINKKSVIAFMADNNVFIEQYRTLGM